MKSTLRTFCVHPFREDNLLFQVVLLFAFVLPLFVWYPAHDSFILPKSVLFQSFSFLALGILLALSLFGRPIRIPFHPTVLLIVLLAVWQLLSRTWSIAPSLSWDQIRETGCLVIWALVLMNVLMNRRDRLLALAWSLVATSFVVSVWALWLDFAVAFRGGGVGVRAALGDWRDIVSSASLGNSGHVADFIVAGFLVSLAFFLTTRSRLWRWLLGADLVLKAAGLIVCWSVHSNLSLVVGAGVLAILLYRRVERTDWRRYVRRLVPLGAAWLLVVAFYVVDHPANPHGSRVWADDPAEVSGGIFAHAFSSERWKEGGSTRWVIWMTTLEIIKDSPWLGTGAGTFTYAYPGVRSEAVWQDNELYHYSGNWTNAAHNDLLQTWSETGIIGSALLILLVGGAFLAMNQRRESAGEMQQVLLATTIAMLVAWCVQAQMNFPLELPVSSMLLFTLFCVPVILPLSGQEDAFRVPIYRDYGVVRVGAMVENVKRPISLHLQFMLPRGVVLVVAPLVVLGGAAIGLKQMERLAASVAYRPVYEGLRNPRAMQNPQARANLRDVALRGLERDPGHWDIRAGLADLYIAEGQYEETLPHLEKIRERLNAFTVLAREGAVYRTLGMDAQADAAWDEFFRRRPDFGRMYPAEFHRWRERNPEAAADLGTP